jgi:hypothetical protein
MWKGWIMTGVDAIRTALQSTQHLITWFLSDLSDADLLVRPVPEANHIAWQIGHFIVTETRLVNQPTFRAVYPELPAGFARQHAAETNALEPATGFATRAEYVDLFTKVRQATIAGLNALSDADLDAPTVGPMTKFAPTLGALLVLAANHSLMHAGQFSVVRRKLGKPVLF